ncbi:hypothetical protein [Amycolatopsis eburnea]|uniref:Uncharacterized protein n=1 Tax=Amycolatopsis eburnea TaxID=2267691 RepID=A0A3R9FCP2_9PSEU|nr:hypothetical protein [Amycolatopsis eburnea]RSD22022.1 hypothetical protein EIY87_09405 [Amycolatopsis eburnea]
MTARGWTNPRILRTVDSAGAQVDVITGVTTDVEGRPVAGIAIEPARAPFEGGGRGNGGPTALFSAPMRERIELNMGQTLADAEVAQRTWRRRPR